MSSTLEAHRAERAGARQTPSQQTGRQAGGAYDLAITASRFGAGPTDDLPGTADALKGYWVRAIW